MSGERGNRYWRWIENYVADDYTDAVGKGEGMFVRCLCLCCFVIVFVLSVLFVFVVLALGWDVYGMVGAEANVCACVR